MFLVRVQAGFENLCTKILAIDLYHLAHFHDARIKTLSDSFVQRVVLDGQFRFPDGLKWQVGG
jgi:hypothetical protein